jgi:hypothetical protein
VRRAADLLAYKQIWVVNLLAIPTGRSGDAAIVGRDADAWIKGRTDLAEAVETSAGLFFAWGRVRHLGAARRHAEAQVSWLASTALNAGHVEAWTVGADVRHPSRWHQYSADRHARTNGGTSEERLREVLLRQPLEVFMEQTAGV